MSKEDFIAAAVKAAQSQARAGSRTRYVAPVSEIEAKAAARWDLENSTEYKERVRFIADMVSRGGNVWENRRVYFNDVKVEGPKGYSTDFYVDIDSRRISIEALAEKMPLEFAAAKAATGL